MRPYFFVDGLNKLADELSGNENIYLGTRPYGFHAGNMLTLLAYPLLLCEALVKAGKTPRFNITVFINDWEQDRLAGPDIKTYPFNIFPLNTTFQYATNTDNPSVNIADYWQPPIMRHINMLQKRFEHLNIVAVRNSEMKLHSAMKRCLLFTIKYPDRIADILRSNTEYPVLPNDLAYAMAVCPHCTLCKGKTSVLEDEKIVHECSNCGKTTEAPYEFFDYWFYHKPLAIPRLEAYNIDLCITGVDHYKEGDYSVRQELLGLFKSSAKLPKTLYVPSLHAKDGERMSKSVGNVVSVDLETLMDLVHENPDEPKIYLPPEAKSFSMSETITADPSALPEVN